MPATAVALCFASLGSVVSLAMAASPSSLPAPTPAPILECVYDPDWNAGWGPCPIYLIDEHSYCDTDADDGVYAYEVCPECGVCVAGPTPAPILDCVQDPDWDAGWGPCPVYLIDEHSYCDIDEDDGVYAYEVCPECGVCAAGPPTPAPPPTPASTPTPAPICVWDDDWDAGYGNCSTYVPRPGITLDSKYFYYNYYYCDVDTVDGNYAYEVCSECGECVEGSPPPSPAPPSPTPAPPPTPAPLPECVQNHSYGSDWDGGYGACTTYAEDRLVWTNFYYCDSDYDSDGVYAHEACPECGECAGGPPTPAPICLRDDDWDAGYGNCSTYASDAWTEYYHNFYYCDVDSYDGNYAYEVCLECGVCVEGPPTPATPPPTSAPGCIDSEAEGKSGATCASSWIYQEKACLKVYDDDDFTAGIMCCTCSECVDTDYDAEDKWGNNCDTKGFTYTGRPSFCGHGYYDDDDFSPDIMCCACGGGIEPCEDNIGFVDEGGYTCDAWVGYDCYTAMEDWYYSQQGMDDLVANCPLACGICYDFPVDPHCDDDPLGWVSSDGTPCARYDYLDFCTPSGGYGTGWLYSYGTFADWANNGISADQACCACGGGNEAPTPVPTPEGTCEDLDKWQQGGSTNTCDDYCENWCDGDSYTSSHIPDNGFLVFATDACCCCGGGKEYACSHVCEYKGQLYADITHPDTYVAWWSTWDGTWSCSKHGKCKCSGSKVVKAKSKPGKGRRLKSDSTIFV